MSKFKTTKKKWLKESFQTITHKKNLDSSASEEKLFVPIQRQNSSVLALPCKSMCWLTWSQRCIPVESSSEILAVFLRLHVQGEHFGNFPAKTSISSIYFTLTLFQKEKTETTYHHKLTELKYLWEFIAHAKEEKKKRFRKEEKQILVSSRADGEWQGGHLTFPCAHTPK